MAAGKQQGVGQKYPLQGGDARRDAEPGGGHPQARSCPAVRLPAEGAAGCAAIAAAQGQGGGRAPPALELTSTTKASCCKSTTTPLTSSPSQSHAAGMLISSTKTTCCKSTATPQMPSSSSLAISSKPSNSSLGAQKVFDENPPQQDVFVGGVLETVEHNLFTVLSNDASSTTNCSISKPFAHISPTSMMLDFVGFLAHQVVMEMPKKTVLQVLCIQPPGQFSERYEFDLFSLRRLSGVFPWCCAFGVHMEGRDNQNSWPAFVHFDCAACDVLPVPWPPPMLVKTTSKGADLRPTPWPSFRFCQGLKAAASHDMKLYLNSWQQEIAWPVTQGQINGELKWCVAPTSYDIAVPLIGGEQFSSSSFCQEQLRASCGCGAKHNTTTPIQFASFISIA